MLGQMVCESREQNTASIVGAGAAGLFAAWQLVHAGRRVVMYEHRSAPALKLALAASSGLNISNTLSLDAFPSRYGKGADRFKDLLADASPRSFVEWVASFGIATHTGSGGKIFAIDTAFGGKTSGDGPAKGGLAGLIGALLHALAESGLFELRTGWSFAGFTAHGRARAERDDGTTTVLERPTLLALGGASWPSTGSDGRWVSFFREAGITVVPFSPANCGLDTANQCDPAPGMGRIPLKNVAVSFGSLSARGDAMLTETGIEGGPVYAHASAVVSELNSHSVTGGLLPALFFDMCPDLAAREVAARLEKPRHGASASNFLRKALGFDAAKRELVRRALGTDGAARVLADPRLAKALPVRCASARPIEEAISCSGGVPFGELDNGLMLYKMPGVFCAGEMIDWDAPTGGFLLTGCYATAYRASRGMDLLL